MLRGARESGGTGCRKRAKEVTNVRGTKRKMKGHGEKSLESWQTERMKR